MEEQVSQPNTRQPRDFEVFKRISAEEKKKQTDEYLQWEKDNENYMPKMIGIICGVIGGLGLIVGGVIVYVDRKRKRAQEAEGIEMGRKS